MTDQKTIKVSTNVVMSIYTGFLLAPQPAFMDAASFLARGGLFTHQLPRLLRVSKKHLPKQIPEVSECPEFTEGANIVAYLEQCERILGTSEFTLRPFTEDEFEDIDPMSELAEHVHPDKIITIQTQSPRK